MKKLLFSLLIILFSGCAYQAKRINVQEETELSYQQTKNNVELTLKSIDTASQESIIQKSNFKNFAILHLQLKNKSKVPYVLNIENIDQKLATIEQVKKSVPEIYLNNFFPSALFLAGGIFFWWQICLPLAVASSIGALFYSKVTNKNCVRNFVRSMLKPNESLVIQPNKQINKILFINKKDYKSRFNLKLINKNNSSEFINFDVFITAKNKFSYIFA